MTKSKGSWMHTRIRSVPLIMTNERERERERERGFQPRSISHKSTQLEREKEYRKKVTEKRRAEDEKRIQQDPELRILKLDNDTLQQKFDKIIHTAHSSLGGQSLEEWAGSWRDEFKVVQQNGGNHTVETTMPLVYGFNTCQEGDKEVWCF